MKNIKVAEKYGKPFDNKSLLRTPQWIGAQIHNAKHEAEQFLTKDKYFFTECPICGSENIKDFAQIYGFIYKECQECFDVFLQNPLKNLTELYVNDGKESSFECYLSDEIFAKRLENIAMPKIAFIDSVVQNLKNNQNFDFKTWLDIGSGGGENLYAAKELGYDIMGFESDKKSLQFSNERLGGEYVRSGFLDITNCDIKLLEWIARVDVITFFNTLEHLENPRKVLGFFGDTMKTGSLLIIEVPRHPSLASYANVMSPHKVYRHLIPPYHLNIFSERALEIMYNGGGVDIVWLVNGVMGRGLWILFMHLIVLMQITCMRVFVLYLVKSKL